MKISILFCLCHSLIANTTFDFAGSKLHKPNYLIVSPIFSQHKYFSIYNLISSHSLYSSFIHSISTSLRIEKSSFSYFLQSVIRSSTINYHHDCSNRRIHNQGIDYFVYDSATILGCSFNSIISSDKNKQGGAIGLQNLQKIEISGCSFTSCSATQGGGFWIYKCENLTLAKDHFNKCESGSSGSSAFVFMNCKFNASQIFISNCVEKSNGRTGTVYIKDSSGNFQYSTFLDNTALKMDNVIELYALLSFEKCNVFISDICFSYQDIKIGRPFMKIFTENCNFTSEQGINRITFPSIQNPSDMLFFINSHTDYEVPLMAFNSSQDKLCHLDFFVFEEGIVKPTPAPTYHTTKTPEATFGNEEDFSSSSENDTISYEDFTVEGTISFEIFSDNETISEINEVTTIEDIEIETTTIEEAKEETTYIGDVEIGTTIIEDNEETSAIDDVDNTTIIENDEVETVTFESGEKATTNDHFEVESSFFPTEYEETETESTTASIENTTIIDDGIKIPKEKLNDITFIIIISLGILLLLIIIAIIIVLCFINRKDRVAFNNDDAESSVDYEVPLIDYKLDDGQDILSPQQI